jgi:NAD(P) transhydrogenase
VIGLEYATMFATLGVQVTVIDGRKRLLEFVDDEIVEALQFRFRAQGGLLRLGESVESVACPLDDREPIRATLESGKTVSCDCLLYAAGRVGATEDLGLAAAGLEADARGRLSVDATFCTANPRIYAAGDVIGFPALASTSAEQGRCAARFALGLPATPPRGTFPYGIYTIPEISMVGRTEADLTAAKVPYEVGVARWRDVARAVIIGDTTGMLKCLFGEDRRLLGVHAIGRGATEIVHIGQAVMDHGGGLDYLVESVFNYPTLAEAFKLAAFDALERMERRGA